MMKMLTLLLVWLDNVYTQNIPLQICIHIHKTWTFL